MMKNYEIGMNVCDDLYRTMLCTFIYIYMT